MTAQFGFGFDDLPPAPAVITEAAAPSLPARGEGGPSHRDGGRGDAVPPPDTRHDGICDVAIATNRNMLVSWYLIASWSYFVGDHPLLTDARIDRLCREIDAEWDSIEHRHKPLADCAWLAAGTCGLSRDAWPASIPGAPRPTSLGPDARVILPGVRSST